MPVNCTDVISRVINGRRYNWLCCQVATKPRSRKWHGVFSSEQTNASPKYTGRGHWRGKGRTAQHGPGGRHFQVKNVEQGTTPHISARVQSRSVLPLSNHPREMLCNPTNLNVAYPPLLSRRPNTTSALEPFDGGSLAAGYAATASARDSSRLTYRTLMPSCVPSAVRCEDDTKKAGPARKPALSQRHRMRSRYHHSVCAVPPQAARGVVQAAAPWAGLPPSHARRSGAPMITATPTSPDGNAAYRAGLCVDCRTRRYSAGRPRCSGCHTDYVTRIGAPIQQAASTVGNLVAQGHGLTHVTVRGPGRCTERSFHVETQGHRERCSGTAPVEPAEDKPRSFFDVIHAPSRPG